MKEKLKYVDITYLNIAYRKTIRRGDFRSKLILNHSSSEDKKKKGCDR